MSSAPQPGTVLAGKYRVEQVLGVGGMGAVVAAHHLQLDQKVAIKYLLPEVLKIPEVIERFSREARAAAKIRGEHVARVIDVGTFDDGAPYIIMEYLEGRDLAKELASSGPLRIDDVARYVLETCEALAQAHAAKIVHRDLKPQNLFLASQPDKRSIIKVLDFGISKIESDAQSRALTNTSAMMGTAFYMSPEQMTSPKSIDHRSDIWSLGVIMYELLAGKPPFYGETVAEVIAGILTNEPAPLRRIRPDVPQGLADVISRCIQTKAADRYASVAVLAAALAPFVGPADRMSVDFAARVLGHPVAASQTAPLSAAPVTETLPTATLARTPPAAPSDERDPAAIAPTKLSGAPPAAATTTGPRGVAPVTTHALTRSTSELQLPKSRLPAAIIAAGAGVLLVGALGFGIKSILSREPPRATGLVSPGASSVPAAETAAPSLRPLGASSPASSPEAPPQGDATEPRPAGTPADKPPSGVVAPASPRPAPVSVRPAASAKPAGSATATPGASATASAQPAPAASAASSASKNPLQMGIK